MYYRLNCGAFVEAETFTEAKAKFIEKIEKEQEDPESWTPCTCLGFSHRQGCPEMDGVIPY